MTLSPKKYVSNFTSSTTNRGVEAKEVEIANTRLDVQASSRSAAPAETVAEDSDSYIQVEVRRARLPHASSPAAPAPPAPSLHTMKVAKEGGAGDVAGGLPGVVTTWRAAGGAGAGAGAGAGLPEDDASEKAAGGSGGGGGGGVWRSLNCAGAGDQGDSDSSEEARPASVEVFYFERGGGAWLAGSRAARRSGLQRAARRAARRGAALLDEAAALPALLLAAPLAALLAAQRAGLRLARAALAGAAQAAADEALKPLLALVFNAALHPPLVFTGNVLRAARDALRPLWGTLGDALEPAARLLAAARLVTVELHWAPPAPLPQPHSV